VLIIVGFAWLVIGDKLAALSLPVLALVDRSPAFSGTGLAPKPGTKSASALNAQSLAQGD
jgi:hypothetical protein